MGRVGGLAAGLALMVGSLLACVVHAEDLPARAPAVGIEVAGPAEVVYRWGAHACTAYTWPDAPARAFRDAGGRVHLLATDSDNWSLIGPSLGVVRTDCHPLLVGGRAADPGAYDDLPWIEGVYTNDGQHVIALVSDEWNAWRHQGAALARQSGCADPHQQLCYFYAITEALSDDGGEHFAYPPGQALVAAPPERFQRLPGSGASQGYATASNIFAHDGHVYAFLGVRPSALQPGGNCLVRTDRPADPTAWRGWDGNGFTVTFINPYRGMVDTPGRHVCHTIAIPADNSQEVRSISWHSASRQFIAIVRGRLTPAGAKTPMAGFFFSTSPDLLHWSGAALIMPLALIGECKPFLVYPSLLDPASPGRNFDTVGDSGYLYFTRFNATPADCRGARDRDLVRVPLKISPAR